jgi:NifU-like protein involved in Fe-S cluster formation
MSGYSPLVRQMFTTLPGTGPLPPGTGPVLVGEAGDLRVGAWVRFEARIEDDRVVAARFAAWGCPHTLAAAAWVAGQLPGVSLAEATALAAPRRLAATLAAPAGKLGRLLKVEDALRALVEARGTDRKR